MKFIKTILIAAAFVAVWALAPVTIGATEPATLQSISGKASWYGGKFHGRPTASGEKFDKNGLTAAHRTLPFGTKVRVTNRANGRTVIVRVNDRGPFIHSRIIDLSRAAADRIGMITRGTAPVSLEILI